MIEKFEKKINIAKKKVNKKVVGVISFMIFGAVLIFGLDMTNNYKRQKQQNEDMYNKSMYELISYVKNVEVELAKLQITTTPNLTSQTLADIWRQANLAKDNLSQLPVNQDSVRNVSKYLSQVSDYSYTLMKQTIADKKISDEQYDKISEIYKQAGSFVEVLNEIYNRLNEGRLKWNEVEKEANKNLPDATDIDTESEYGIGSIGKTFQTYQGLIYDGAFSDHILNIEPKGVSDEECTKEDGEEKIKEIFGEETIEYITFNQESQGRLDLFNYSVKLKDKENIYSMDITKKGCKMYLMLSDRNVEEEKISMDDAKKLGIEFLEKLGITNVKDTYYLKTENMATINYASVQDRSYTLS